MKRQPLATPPRTNHTWPEGFGFRIGGNAPVIITDIFEESYAQKSGLRPGDQLLEVDGVNVQGLSKEDVISLARQSTRVPPALCVISRIRSFTLRRRRGTFGFKVRGGGPVFVSQLEERGPAKVAGIRLGDMLVEVNNTSVREMTYIDVERLINTSGSLLQLVMIAGVKSIEEIEKRNTASRFRRAREFFQEMNYYLAGEEKKRSQLVKLLNKFAKDKSVETLARGIMKILETPVQKRLIPTIKQLIPRDKRKIFTDILQENQKASLKRSASFDEKTNIPPAQSKSPVTSGSKFRTWSKGSKSPTKQTPPTSPRGNTISYHQRPSPAVLQNDLEQSNFQRSYSTSAASSPRRSPELYLGEADRSVQNLAETFKFQMNQFLTRGEQLVLKQRLKEYHKHRNAKLLVSTLEPILDDREKLKMVPYLSQLLPENEQYNFDKEAQKLMAKYLQGSSSEGPDVIDVAYRVQGLRLGESPQPKNLIGGSNQGDLDLYPVKERPNSPRSNESSTVAALLTAAENTTFSNTAGNTITVEALVHSNKHQDVNEAARGTSISATQGQDTFDSKSSDLPSVPTAEISTELGEKSKGEIKSRSTHRDLSSAIEDQKKHLAQQASKEVPPPPAPMGGGLVPPAPPPPPPPPPTGMNSKNDTLPKMQLKRVNWEKLGIAGLENTVWGQLGRNDPLDELEDFVELEQQFSSAKRAKAPATSKKQEKIEILEPRKQYNIAILLGHLKLPHEEIKRAVLSMDETTLSEAHVKQLLLYAPDHKETQKYKHFADDEGKLGQCDKFSLLVSKIPGYRHRLKAMLFKLHFADKLEEIKPELERVVKASQELRESKKLQQVLQLVLAFGNHMNQGNARIAGASAFRVGFLAKLSSTKTSDNKSNLLKFLVKTVETKCPEVLDLKNELSSISLAARVSYQMVKEEIDDVVKTMEDVKTDLEEHGSQIPENDEDKFAEIMGSFVENSKRDMEILLTLHSEMQSEYTKTAKFFGEDPNMTTTEEFFGIFSTFVDQFETARLELVTQKKRKEEQAKRDIEKQGNRLKKLRGITLIVVRDFSSTHSTVEPER
ncbi:delphilin-like isoform X2 [Dendronephthya gigantea]|uniref:delphilin-like isoform X2 n=1 Tax=Dendronephthya gigantea TaxID=151771 RepID=UPI00106D983C|nr:delphilin-like isoform X2 [Dendronephthya gigantea]